MGYLGSLWREYRLWLAVSLWISTDVGVALLVCEGTEACDRVVESYFTISMVAVEHVSLAYGY